jgi:phosphatidate cytidylyltransferase
MVWSPITAALLLGQMGPRYLDQRTNILLGTVLIVLIVAFIVGRLLRRQPESTASPAVVHTFNNRVGTWWLMYAVLIAGFLVGYGMTVTLFGLVSFWALREFITMTPTRRGDHRILFWTFFILTPAHYLFIGLGWYGLYTVLIPVYASLLIPARIAISGDPKRFLERVAKIQAGLLICVYSLSHAPALLHLNLKPSSITPVAAAPIAAAPAAATPAPAGPDSTAPAARPATEAPTAAVPASTLPVATPTPLETIPLETAVVDAPPAADADEEPPPVTPAAPQTPTVGPAKTLPPPTSAQRFASSAGLLFYFILIVQLNDVFQYVWGHLFGKTVIAPQINASRTWEGFIGGVLSTMLVGTLLCWATPFKLWEAACIAGVVAIMGFAGSMTMSGIKRDRGVKDYGTLVSGHAGVLDRIDSICFAAPVFFHIVRYFYT